MYRDAWRMQREFFYDPHFHGLDLAAAEKKYEPFLAGVSSRSDLNYLFAEMLGDITVSHLGWGEERRPRCGAWPRACWARTSPSTAGDTGSRESTTVKTGTRSSARR